MSIDLFDNAFRRLYALQRHRLLSAPALVRRLPTELRNVQRASAASSKKGMLASSRLFAVIYLVICAYSISIALINDYNSVSFIH